MLLIPEEELCNEIQCLTGKLEMSQVLGRTKELWNNLGGMKLRAEKSIESAMVKSQKSNKDTMARLEAMGE
jgi:hypothetical protein